MKIVTIPGKGFRAIGIPPGRFLRIHQGFDTRAIMPVGHQQEGHMAFMSFDEEPECLWGTGIYRVRTDGTLQPIKQDYDTSD